MNSGRANASELSDCLRSIAVLRTFLHMYNKDIADVSQVSYIYAKEPQRIVTFYSLALRRNG